MSAHLITGAGSGIGSALAHLLADRGEQLFLVARSQTRADELSGEFPEARFVVADLGNPSAIAAAVAEVGLESLDSLVHAAGAVDLAPAAELDLATWQHQLDVNLTAPAVLTSACLPALRAARGTAVFVNSGAGLAAHPTWGAYAASKFGLRAFADALRGEEAAHGVRVTTVYPGRTATPMQEKVHQQEGKAYDAGDWIQPGTVADAVLRVLDLPADATIPDLTLRPR